MEASSHIIVDLTWWKLAQHLFGKSRENKMKIIAFRILTRFPFYFSH